MIKVVVAIMFLSLMGCSTYRHKIETGTHPESPSSSAFPYILAIDGSNLIPAKMNAATGTLSYEIEYGEHLLNLLKNKNQKNFKNVIVINKDDKAEYDFILMPKNNISSVCNPESCLFTSNQSFEVKYKIDDRKNLMMRDFTDQFDFHSSDFGIRLFSILTVVTLPIMVPAVGDMRGEEIKNSIIQSNERISTRVAEMLYSAEFFEKK